jgi:ParB/RepB/Spo0J family partition protein
LDRDFRYVPAGKVHNSSLLPSRQHGEELPKSVKQTGIQQPIIVRPMLGTQDEYEIIDGRGRRESISDDEQIPIDIRNGVSDSEVFRISESTFQRKDRTAYETALFYAAWLKTLEKETGSVEGLQQKIAEKTNISESSLSQYIAIARLFDKLNELAPKEHFSTLKTWSVNKLYKLSELIDDNRLIDVARFFELKFETSIEEIEETVNCYRGMKQPEETMPAQQEPVSGQVEPSIHSPYPVAAFSDESKKTCLRNVKRVSSLANETHDVLNSLVQELLQDSDHYSSDEIIQTLTKILHALRKLKRHSSVLKLKMKPTKTGVGAQ